LFFVIAAFRLSPDPKNSKSSAMSHVERAHGLLASGQSEGAIAELESGIAAGDPASALELGIWLLEGQRIPRDLTRSRDYFRQAAELGDPTGENVYLSFLA